MSEMERKIAELGKGCDQSVIQYVKSVIEKIPEDRLTMAQILVYHLLKTPEYRGKVLRYTAQMLTEEGKFLRKAEAVTKSGEKIDR